MTAHDWLEHAAPYALGALDVPERAAFEKHLATCDMCRAEVRELREVAGLLALAAPRSAPPAGLRERIMSDARAIRPITAGARTETNVASRTAGSWARFAPWAAAAAAVIFATWIGQRYRGERAARIAAERTLENVRASLDSAGSALVARDALIATLTSPDVQAVSVSGTVPDASVRYFLDRRRGRIVVAASSLTPAAPGRTYQVWGIATGKPPVSLGTFDTDSSGAAVAALPIPQGLRIAVTAVTDEPAGGSPQPTTTPFLVATWKTE